MRLTRAQKASSWQPWLLVMVWLPLPLMMSGCGSPKSEPITYVLDSERVFLIEPNDCVPAPWPAVMLSRGRYIELRRIEMRVRAGYYVPAEPGLEPLR